MQMDRVTAQAFGKRIRGRKQAMHGCLHWTHVQLMRCKPGEVENASPVLVLLPRRMRTAKVTYMERLPIHRPEVRMLEYTAVLY